MFDLRLRTAAALAGLGLLCGCANTNSAANPCGERQGFLTRMFSGWGNRRAAECPCIETGNVTVGDGPVVPDPGCCAPGCSTPAFPVSTPFAPPSSATFVPPSSAPFVPPMPPPTALPLPGSNPLAQPIPANPSSAVKDVAK